MVANGFTFSQNAQRIADGVRIIELDTGAGPLGLHYLDAYKAASDAQLGVDRIPVFR
jgi:hypothetical protein